MEVVAAIAVVFVGLVVFALVQKSRRQRRRRQRLIEWAARNGWAFTPSPAVDWASRLPGRNKKGVSLALSATIGRHPVSVGEYSYTESHISSAPDGAGGTTTTTTSQTHQYIVTVVRLAQSYHPIAVQPRKAMSRLGRRLGKDDPNATGNDRFDRQFKVHADDMAYARHLVGPALVAEHVAGTVPPWNLHGNELLAYRNGRLDKPEQVPALVAPLIRVADLLGR
jgi:hypothetical protein